MNITREIGARGLNCPMPILHTKKIFNNISGGGVLNVTTSDPRSPRNMEVFCRQTGYELLPSLQNGASCVFLVHKS
ncbi:MAG: sulfurtransferase TusA family protein [Acidiferrobacterales bacterium]